MRSSSAYDDKLRTLSSRVPDRRRAMACLRRLDSCRTGAGMNDTDSARMSLLPRLATSAAPSVCQMNFARSARPNTEVLPGVDEPSKDRAAFNEMKEKSEAAAGQVRAK